MAVFNKTKLKQRAAPTTKSGLIMVVDDEPANLSALSAVLEERYNVLTALDGQEALDIIRNLEDPGTLRLVISDQRMPRMTGTELFEQLLTVAPSAIRIILTGYSDIQAITDAINKAQIYRYVCKPFDRNDMLMTVERAIEAFEMREGKAIAEARSKAKTDFLATMSHEIRTPLNGVIGMLNLLNRTSLSAPQSEMLSTAQTCAESLLELINDILDMSKVEAGQMTLETVPFDLFDVVEAVADNQSINADNKGLDLIVDYPPWQPRRFMGDPVRLRQVVMNLTGNAIKFTSKGHVAIAVKPGQMHEGKMNLLITVTDTGIGIPKDKIATIFEKFGQADASTTRLYGGTGLGLSISRQLAELMGGSIEVESTPGEGSVFKVNVALEPAPGDATGNEPSMPGYHVMLAVQNPTQRGIIDSLFRHEGCTVTVAESGDDALGKLTELSDAGTEINVLIVDYALSDIDYEMMVSCIKGDPTFEKVRLMLLGPTAILAQSERLQGMGFDGCITKPLHAADAIDTINRLRKGEQGFISRSRKGKGGFQGEMHFPGSRILVVDDNPINREVAGGLLSLIKCSSDFAASGAEALQKAAANTYDVILMDCQMPEMDGYQTTGRLRQMEGSEKRTPVIALTANALEGDRQRCLDAGMDDYLSKPVRPEALQEKFRHWLAKYATPGVASTPSAPKAAGAGEDEIDRIASLMGDTFAGLVNTFMTSTPTTIQGIEEALREQNREALSKTAHALAGSASSIGAMKLSGKAKALENASLRQMPDNAADMFAEVMSAYNETANKLQAYTRA